MRMVLAAAREHMSVGLRRVSLYSNSGGDILNLHFHGFWCGGKASKRMSDLV